MYCTSPFWTISCIFQPCFFTILSGLLLVWRGGSSIHFFLSFFFLVFWMAVAFSAFHWFCMQRGLMLIFCVWGCEEVVTKKCITYDVMMRKKDLSTATGFTYYKHTRYRLRTYPRVATILISSYFALSNVSQRDNDVYNRVLVCAACYTRIYPVIDRHTPFHGASSQRWLQATMLPISAPLGY